MADEAIETPEIAEQTPAVEPAPAEPPPPTPPPPPDARTERASRAIAKALEERAALRRKEQEFAAREQALAEREKGIGQREIESNADLAKWRAFGERVSKGELIEALTDAGLDPDKAYQEMTGRYLRGEIKPRERQEQTIDPRLQTRIEELAAQQQALKAQLEAEQQQAREQSRQQAIAREVSELEGHVRADKTLVALADAFDVTPAAVASDLFAIRAENYRKTKKVLDSAECGVILLERAKAYLARSERLKAVFAPTPDAPAPPDTTADPEPSGSKTLSRRHVSQTAPAKRLTQAERMQKAYDTARNSAKKS